MMNKKLVNADQRFSLDHLRVLARRKDSGIHLAADAVRVHDLLRRGPTIPELEQAIAVSPDLALKIVRVASSSAFAAGPIHSLSRAIDVVGFLKLKNVLITLALDGYQRPVGRDPGIDLDALKKRSICIAILSQTLAPRLTHECPDTMYLAGLFQEVGLLALACLAPERTVLIGNAISRTPDGDPVELERFYLGFDHAEAGAMLAEEYNMAEEVQDAIAFHHQPFLYAGPHQHTVDLAHLCGWLATELGCPIYPTVYNQPLDKCVCLRLKVDPASLFGLKDTVQDASETMELALAA